MTENELKSILRNNGGLIGETTRVLTEFYFNPANYRFSDFDNPLDNLIDHRNSLYENIDQIQQLDSREISTIRSLCQNDLPYLFTIFSCLESFPNENIKKVCWGNLNLVYSVAQEEHIEATNRLGEIPIFQGSELSSEQLLFLQEILNKRFD